MHLLIRMYLLLTGLVFANVTIEDNNVDFKDFQIDYYIDESKKMNFETVKNQNFTRGKNQKSFSSDSTHLWIKVQITNKNLNKQKLFLHHHNAYRLKYIKFYETKNSKLVNSFDMNLSDTNDTQEMYGTDAIYKFILQHNETKTIYIQTTSFIYQYCSIMLFDEKHSAQYLASGHFSIIVILSILIGLMFYHFILYLITFFKDYLYYSLYLFFNLLWGGYEYGIFGKYFSWYGEKYFIFQLTVIFAIIFLILFVKNILQTPKLYPRENKYLNLIIIIFILNLSYIFIDIYTTLYLYVIATLITLPIYVVVIISLFRKKNKYVFYFIFAQIWFIFFGFIGLFFYEGISDYTFVTRYSYILGIFLDTFAFSYLLSHRIRLVQEENKKNIHKSKRLEALSELLENISHQWRQPLTRINSSVMRIAIEMKKNKITNVNMEKKLNDIEKLSVYLSQTIDDFKSLYRQDREISQFNLRNAIEDSISLIGDEYKKHNIEVTLDVSNDIYLHNYVNEFKQVLQVILNNAKDALIESQIANPNILIVVEKKNKHILLQISNNGGEIDKKVIDKIFDAHFSTKKQGEGIGLFMSQKILNELMNTSLSCHNIAGGVCFEIKFRL